MRALRPLLLLPLRLQPPLRPVQPAAQLRSRTSAFPLPRCTADWPRLLLRLCELCQPQCLQMHVLGQPLMLQPLMRQPLKLSLCPLRSAQPASQFRPRGGGSLPG